jgi:hypothetical protein
MSIHGRDNLTDTDEADESLPEIWQTHIKDPDREFTAYAEIEVDNPERKESDTYTGDSRALMLTAGGEVGKDADVSQENPYAWETSAVGNVNRTIAVDAAHGVGYYLYSIETHGLDEEGVMLGLETQQEEVGLPLDAYREFQSELDESARQLRLLDLLDTRVTNGNDWASEPYLEAGTWREKGLTPSQTRLAQRIEKKIDPHPRLCYRTAQLAVKAERDNHRVKYVEGIALAKQAAQAIRHAWIEIDGKVVELTWPWHKYDGDEAVYFGVEFDTETVIETFERRGGGSQIILDEEEAAELIETRANRGR